jgi:hypothetical protein
MHYSGMSVYQVYDFCSLQKSKKATMKRHNSTLWLGIVSGQTLVYIFFILLSINMTERSHFNLPIREKPTKSLDIEQY